MKLDFFVIFFNNHKSNTWLYRTQNKHTIDNNGHHNTVGALSHLPFPDSTSDLEFLKRGNKCRSRNERCEKVHQTDSNPGPHDE